VFRPAAIGSGFIIGRYPRGLDVSAAIIGLLGVVVGALVTALGSVWVERRREIRATANAERGIKSALVDAQRQLETTVEDKSWWPESSPLQVKIWSDQAFNLSPHLPVEDRRKLDDGFAALDMLNKIADSERAENDPLPTLTEVAVEGVRNIEGIVRDALDVLNRRESGRRRTRLFVITAISLIVVVLATVGITAGARSLTGPPSVTANSLASSIQRTTHVDFASCEQEGTSTADWQCFLADFSGPGCSSGLLSAPASQASRIEFTRAFSTDCAVVGESAVEVEVNKASCYLWQKLKKIPLSSGDHLPVSDQVASGQPPNALQAPTASGCI
jgi:hypothetical protein